jgi:toxin ParE1/3/4
MTLPVEFHPHVADDIEDGRRFYERQQPGLGDRFVAAVEVVYDELRANPQRYGYVEEDVRCGPAGRFPFGVYYQVEPARVYVLAVDHLRRGRPGWMSRV